MKVVILSLFLGIRSGRHGVVSVATVPSSMSVTMSTNQMPGLNVCAQNSSRGHNSITQGGHFQNLAFDRSTKTIEVHLIIYLFLSRTGYPSLPYVQSGVSAINVPMQNTSTTMAHTCTSVSLPGQNFLGQRGQHMYYFSGMTSTL